MSLHKVHLEPNFEPDLALTQLLSITTQITYVLTLEFDIVEDLVNKPEASASSD
jgi:hypothetical protein